MYTANTGIQRKIRGKIRGSFRRPPLAQFGADAARYFGDHTTGVSGTGPATLGKQRVASGVY